MTNEMIEQGAAAAVVDVAVVGATGLSGEALLALLDERNFPVGELYLLGDESEVGKKLEFRGSYLKLTAAGSFDFASVKLVFLLDAPELAAMVGEQAAIAGCTVIDLSGHFRSVVGVPVVVPEVNGDYFAGGFSGQIIASPVGCVAPLSRLLDLLNHNGGLSCLTITVMEPVSWAGRAGVEELAKQTANLLNARPISPELFTKQAAFNVLPQIGEAMEDGYTSEEQTIIEDLQNLLAIPDLPIAVTAVQVPTFFGFGVVVHLELANRVSALEAAEMFGSLSGVEVVTDGYPTAVTEALEQDLLFVGRIRESNSYYGSLAFWLVFDHVRNGAVLNGVKIAETMIKSYM